MLSMQVNIMRKQYYAFNVEMHICILSIIAVSALNTFEEFHQVILN